MTVRTVTKDIEAAQSELDSFGAEMFPSYHSITDDGEYSLYTTVTREFDVAELMTGLVIEVDPSYDYHPSPYVLASIRADYEAAYAMTSEPEFWEKTEVSDYPEVVEEFGEETTERGICILQDSSAMSDLLCDYFTMEAASETNAVAQLSEYMRLLDKADRAYRSAGWEL